MATVSSFYVYAYLRETDGTPYYIGKGKGSRAYKGKHSVVIPKDPNRIVMMNTQLTEPTSLMLERFWIAVYGRKVDGGILRNKTTGGDGWSGMKHTAESKAKITNLYKDGHTPWNKGKSGHKIHSEEHKAALSAAMKGNKRNANRRPYTEEELRKRSERQKQIWAERKGGK